jgi:hypothetical protein
MPEEQRAGRKEDVLGSLGVVCFPF